jgi:hypothetical protein
VEDMTETNTDAESLHSESRLRSPSTESIVQPGNIVRTAFDIKRAVESKNNAVFGYCVNHKWIVDEDEHAEENAGTTEEEGPTEQKLQFTTKLFHSIFDKWMALEWKEAPCWSSGRLHGAYSLQFNLPQFEGEVHPFSLYRDTLEYYGSGYPEYGTRFGLDQATFEKRKELSILEYLHDYCSEESPYGDVATLSTQTDPSVRKARQIDFTEEMVGPHLLEAVRDAWAVKMYPAKVRVEPYKINLYPEDGMFKQHKDTPADQLIGTLLVGLGYSKKSDEVAGKHLKIYSEGTTNDWACDERQWCAFYSDVVHEVVPFAGSGIRGTLPFKIYACDEENEGIIEPKDVEETAGTVAEDSDSDEHALSPPMAKRPKVAEHSRECQETTVPLDLTQPSLNARHLQSLEHEHLIRRLNRLQRPFGFLLSHEYSMGFSTLKGIDAKLKETLEQMENVELLMFPVVTRISKEWDNPEYADREEHPVWKTSVAALSSGHVDRVLRLPEQAKDKALLAKIDALLNTHVNQNGKIPMAIFSETSIGGVWSSHSQEGGYVGNHACPNSEKSIYLQAALIVLEKKQ